MVQQTVELVKSDTVVEIDGDSVKVYDNTPGYRPLRQILQLEDAITLAKAILAFAESVEVDWQAEVRENRHELTQDF